jgi:hypothetical protein
MKEKPRFYLSFLSGKPGFSGFYHFMQAVPKQLLTLFSAGKYALIQTVLATARHWVSFIYAKNIVKITQYPGISKQTTPAAFRASHATSSSCL